MRDILEHVIPSAQVRVFGSEYARYRKFLHNHYRSYDNAPLLLKTVNQAIRDVDYYRKLYKEKEIGSLAEFEETIGFLGKDGGKSKQLVDLAITVPAQDTQRIQEGQITIGHIIFQQVEQELFG